MATIVSFLLVSVSTAVVVTATFFGDESAAPTMNIAGAPVPGPGPVMRSAAHEMGDFDGDKTHVVHGGKIFNFGAEMAQNSVDSDHDHHQDHEHDHHCHVDHAEPEVDVEKRQHGHKNPEDLFNVVLRPLLNANVRDEGKHTEINFNHIEFRILSQIGAGGSSENSENGQHFRDLQSELMGPTQAAASSRAGQSHWSYLLPVLASAH